MNDGRDAAGWIGGEKGKVDEEDKESEGGTREDCAVVQYRNSIATVIKMERSG